MRNFASQNIVNIPLDCSFFLKLGKKAPFYNRVTFVLKIILTLKEELKFQGKWGKIGMNFVILFW